MSLPDRFTKAIRLVKIFQGEFLIEFYDFTENEFLKTPLIDKSVFNIHYFYKDMTKSRPN